LVIQEADNYDEAPNQKAELSRTFSSDTELPKEDQKIFLLKKIQGFLDCKLVD